MKKVLTTLAVAALSASQAFGAVNLIEPGYAGNVIFSMDVGRAHGGGPARFLVGPGANIDVSSPGVDHVDFAFDGSPLGAAGPGGPGTKGDFFSVFGLTDVLGTGGSKLDIPSGTQVVGLFYGLEDKQITDPGAPGGEIFLESTGGRVEFYLIDSGFDINAGPSLDMASWNASDELIYAGINDGTEGVDFERLLAFNLKGGELGAGDDSDFDSAGGIIDSDVTDLRNLNTSPGGAAGNNGAFYAVVDKSFGNTALANRLANGGFGTTTGTADVEGDYTMNPNFLENPFTAGNFALDFNDPIRGTVTAIPEPSTILLLGTGLMGLVAYRRRRA